MSGPAPPSVSPRTSKEFLRAWYGRRGYRVVRTGRLDDAYPHLAPLLATPCDFVIHEKPLRASGAPADIAASSAVARAEGRV